MYLSHFGKETVLFTVSETKRYVVYMCVIYVLESFREKEQYFALFPNLSETSSMCVIYVLESFQEMNSIIHHSRN